MNCRVAPHRSELPARTSDRYGGGGSSKELPVRPLPRLSLTLLLAASLLAGGSVADGAQPQRRPDLRHVHRLKAIPPEQLSAFPILREPAAVTVPDSVLRAFASLQTARTYAVDPRQARAIKGLRGGTWYVVPGGKGLCFAVHAASACATTADALAGRLALSRVRATVGGASADSPHTVLGVAPAGTSGVTAQLLSGAIATGELAVGGTYRLDLPEAFTDVELTRTGAASLTVFALSPAA
jgi:hypothetical protein